MKSWKTPTAEQVAKAVALIAHPAQHRYFFENLSNPRWVPTLKDKGFFKNPPPAHRDDKEGTLAFPHWPESKYLARMAAFDLDDVRPVILAAILEIDTDNVVVHCDLIDAVLSMPPSAATIWIEKEATWISRQRVLYALYPQKAGQLISHLAKGGQVEAAMILAESLLQPLSDPRKTSDEGRRYWGPEPTARFDLWRYERILRNHIAELVRADPTATLSLLCSLLEKALKLSRNVDEAEWQDYSSTWRPAIEDHNQNISKDIKSLLAGAVRDAAEYICRADVNEVNRIITFFERRRWIVFRRIALHILRLFPDRDVLVEKLSDYTLFDNPDFRHEYALLMRDCFQVLPPERRSEILDWIEKGLPKETVTRIEESWTGTTPSPERIERHLHQWRLRRLAWFKDSLPPEWRERYDRLVEEFGEPEHPEFTSYISGGAVGPLSPKSAEQLATLSVTQLIEFLQSWSPSRSDSEIFDMSESPEGLGRQLQQMVKSRATYSSAQARHFRGLQPTYIRSIISGLHEALKENQNLDFDWESVLELCTWAVDQPLGDMGLGWPHSDRDPGWRWARRTIAELISSGFGPEVAEIPYSLRNLAWSVIRPLTEDPDPTRESETKFLESSNLGSYHLAINTVRGEALEAAIRYGLWVHRHSAVGGESIRRLDLLPELREVLKARLTDPSLAIRAVYGRWFPWLVLLDPSWAQSNVSLIFPLATNLRSFFDAAWLTYLSYCPPYDEPFQVLRDCYRHAVEEITEKPIHEQGIFKPHERLAEHLILLYGRGRLALDEPESILKLFYEKAIDSLARHATSFAGRMLNGDEKEVESDLLERLMSLWTWRLEVARRAASPEPYLSELPEFGWWFASRRFDPGWSLRNLKQTLELTRKINSEIEVAEYLAELCEHFTPEVLKCLELMIKAITDPWDFAIWKDDAYKILKAAMESGDSGTSDTARRLVHYLGSRGFFEFRHLLPHQARCP